jgi:hypothetical protein
MDMNRAPIIGLVVLVTVAFGFALVDRQLQAARERPAVQRIESYKRLQQLAAAFRLYHRGHQGAWPDHLGDMLKEQHLGLGFSLVRGAGVYQYRKPPAGAPGDWIIMWSETNHAGVAKGAPFGAAGEVAQQDIPPIAYVLRSDLSVDELSLEQLDGRLAAVLPTAPAAGPAAAPAPAPPAGPAPAPAALPAPGAPAGPTPAPAPGGAQAVVPASPPAPPASLPASPVGP